MKKSEQFYFYSGVEKYVTRYTDYIIMPLHIKCHCVTDTGVEMKVYNVAVLFATIISLNTQKRKIML